ncbi:MAG: NAD-dependent epimerase/dehydratase family protein [Acidimicrobiia bacterium]|nr:NAD-dependent epimerase/dehydratase family protein [Acidimicrobiia bacterium]
MKVLVTGGLGFLGRLVAGRLVARGDEVVVLDRAGAPVPRTTLVSGAVTDPEAVARALGDGVGGVDAVVHLAAMVSAECEDDLDGALHVNVWGLGCVLDACRRLDRPPRLVFASSVAVFGAHDRAEGVGDTTKQAPASTYGATKAIGELLVNEYTRRGLVDGRTARLPTVIVRPGRPNAAASGFASSVVREPLAGLEAVLPVDPRTPICVIGHRAAVAGLVALLDLDGAALGPDRAVGLPGLEVTAGDLVGAVAAVAGAEGRELGPVHLRPDPLVAAVVGSWPGRWDARRALALGLPADGSLEAVVRDHLADFAPPGRPSR